ncbi:polycystic kidney disease protein 1-like 1 [Vombatus ursinus]|uniref:polycystic kidney disease protein 1-like 1 n=1 Tax=Vombatus ursinus TaxID=29139 RepID=UPI000FFD2F1B|nr:polycystic kidney disease protein 1-like 1 [Vombatus ursinus]
MEGGYWKQGWRLLIQAVFLWILLAVSTPGNNSKDDLENGTYWFLGCNNTQILKQEKAEYLATSDCERGISDYSKFCVPENQYLKGNSHVEVESILRVHLKCANSGLTHSRAHKYPWRAPESEAAASINAASFKGPLLVLHCSWGCMICDLYGLHCTLGLITTLLSFKECLRRLLVVVVYSGHLCIPKNSTCNWTLENDLLLTSGIPVIVCRCLEMGLHIIGLTVSDVASTAPTQSLFNVTLEKAGIGLLELDSLSPEVLILLPLKHTSETVRNLILSFGDEKMQTPPIWGSSNNRSINITFSVPGICDLSVSVSNPHNHILFIQCLPGHIRVGGSNIDGKPAFPLRMNHTSLWLPENNRNSAQELGFGVQTSSDNITSLVFDFGDGEVVQVSIKKGSDEVEIIAYHQYRKEATYMIKVIIFNEFHSNEKELGPYYVEISQDDLGVFMNSSSVHKDEVLLFASSFQRTTGVYPRSMSNYAASVNKGPIVMHKFSSTSSYNVFLMVPDRANGCQDWVSVNVQYQMQAVSIFTNGTVFATDSEVTFFVLTNETSPLEFVWHFGDGSWERTASKSVKKRYSVPKWYHVIVNAANEINSVTSDIHTISIERKIVPNRLVSSSSALINSSVNFECRINFGTNVTYLWNFGDDTIHPGKWTESHIYKREGEFTVEVLIFNSVSVAALKKQVFIVPQPCQPPLVKNMGPGRVQIWRHQPLKLGVTFEAPIQCDISRGLNYSWSLIKSDGSRVLFPTALNKHRQTILLPSYFLEYGNYTALAKVKIEGSVVYSNYSVVIEVVSQPPVSVISEGTHLLISKTPFSIVVLNGSQSFDPDDPGTHLEYYWKCVPASKRKHTCFNSPRYSLFNSSASVISFPASLLHDSYDQFLVTLVVSSGNRNSSEAQVFLSVQSGSTFRPLHISWVHFKDNSVNWNEEFSLQVKCEECTNMPNISYSWDLFLINATETNDMEVSFCRATDLLGSSSLTGAILTIPKSNPPSTVKQMTIPSLTTTPFPRDASGLAIRQLALSAPVKTSVSATSINITIGFHHANDTSHRESSSPSALENSVQEGLLYPMRRLLEKKSVIRSTQREKLPSTELPQNSSYISDFEAYYSNIKEAIEPPRGRQPGESINITELRENEETDIMTDNDDGYNLIDLSYSTENSAPLLMVDWSKSLISRAVFQSYTSSGITSKTVTFKPFFLRGGETYVIQASIESSHSPLGKAQLYFTVNEVPKEMACQVQPIHGYEAYTVFSVFCMSGKADYHYEFSYQIGKSSKIPLYRGRDIQYYFTLPAGETVDKYKVTVFTEITNRYGSKSHPCAVNVTVLPSFHRNISSLNYRPEEDLYNSSLKNLTILLLMGNFGEIRNYVIMLTRILNHFYTEEQSSTFGLQSQMRNLLISSVCNLSSQDQEEMADSILMLNELISISKQVTFDSAVLIIKYVRKLIDHNNLFGQFLMNKELMSKLVILASKVMEVKEKEKSRNAKHFREEGIKSIAYLLLNYVSSSKEPQFNISTGQLEFQTSLHYTFHNSVEHVGSVEVHLPDALDEHISDRMGSHSQCHISQLIYFKEYPYLEERVPVQIDRAVVSLSLYNCTSKKKINIQRLESPVRVVFKKISAQDSGQNNTIFSLHRDKVNFHYFSGLPEASQESLQIVVEFSKTNVRTFPIMLLVRFSEKPTLSTFNVKQIRSWDEQVVQIYIPAVSLKDAASGYLSLLDADHDKKPTNKYLANTVNYTVSFHWIRCLFWDENRGWISEISYPQQGTTPQTVNCSYNHFTTFTVVRRKLNADFEMNDVSLLKSIPQNLLPSILVMVFMFLFAFLAIASKRRDLHEQKKDGYIFLQENSQARNKQVYVVIIDTGFRAPAQLTARVHIVFYGEYEFSETRELFCPEKPLFERNSRHTFIVSIPNNLGPLWKIHLWHDNSGCSPSWYISHVIVKDLITGASWFFPAECWLAVNKWEGKVDRELMPLKNGLGFRKLLYSKFTEYLEDFHMWISVYSRPSYSCFTHTERLVVCLFLILGYMSINATLITMEQEEHFPEVGLPDVSVVSLMNGMLSIFIISPVALLLSLLFRLSERTTRNPIEDQYKSQRRSPIYSAKGHDFHQWTQNSQNQYEQNTLEEFTLEASLGNENEKKEGSGAASLRYSGHFEGISPDRLIPKGSYAHSNCSSEPCNGLEEPAPRKLIVLPLWLSYVAWVTCGLVSMACGLVTGLLGYRFGSSECIQWIHSVFFSIVGCIFVAQPLVIFAAALALAWRKRDHKGFFIKALYDATKNLEYELRHLSKNRALYPSYCCTPNTAADFEKILVARQRARYLQWIHPPTPAQLKEARGRIRKEVLLQTARRNFFTYIIMLFLLLFIIFGKISRHEYVLNQAIQNEFTRNARNSFIEVKNADEWWNWSLTTLLDSLYWDKQNNTDTPKTQSGPLGGKCHLIGTSVIRQLKFTGQFSIPIEASSLVHQPQNQDNENILQSDPEKVKVTQTKRCLHCDQVENEDDEVSAVSLGRTRAKAYSVLINLKNSGWINKRTREVSMHFALYNPPTNLFTSVSLLAEVLPTGDIITSSLIESFSIYHSHSVMGYCIMFSELVFLVFSLIRLCFQMFVMIQKGIFSYWQDSWNWLEMCIIAMSFSYFAHSIFHFILVVDVIDQFHKGFFQVFVDFNPILSWHQRNRCLQGILLFLLLIKCLRLLGVYKTIAPSLTMMRLSCSNIILPVLAGVLLTAAYSYLGQFLFSAHAFPFRSFADYFQMLLLCFLGTNEKRTFFSLYKSDHYATVYYYGTLCIAVIILWSGILRGVLISFMQDAKRSFRSQRLLRFKDVADHTWEKVLYFLGIQKPVIAVEETVKHRNFCLDEFESLMDELLLRVNGLYYSLHCSPLEKPPRDQAEIEQKDETLAYNLSSPSMESNI